MDRTDMISELRVVKDRLREQAFVIIGIMKNMHKHMPDFIKKLTPEEAFTHGFEAGYIEKETELQEKQEKTRMKFLGGKE